MMSIFPQRTSRKRKTSSFNHFAAVERLENRTLLSGTAAATVSQSYDFSNGTDVTISSRSTSTNTSEIEVTGVDGILTDVNVTIDIDHSNDNHLTLTLIAPDGTRITLADRVGGSGNDFSGTVFDDEASTSISSGSAPFSGSYLPESSLSAIDGIDPNGTWTLEVKDSVRRRGGRLNSWSLNLTAETTDTGGDDTGTGGGTDTGGGGTDTGGGGTDPGGTTTTEVEVVSVFENTQNVNISSGRPNTRSSAIDVGGLNGPVIDVNVTIDIDHAADRDLRIYLISPDGTRVTLASELGGTSDDYSSTTFDDQASQAITSGSAPFSGTFRAQGTLSDFDGSDGNGTWTLRVEDTRRRNGGSIRGWSLEITTLEEVTVPTDPPPPATGVTGTVALNATTYQVGDVVNVSVNDADLDGQSQISVDVTSGSDTETLVLNAAGGGLFTGQLNSTAANGSLQDGILNVAAGGSISVDYNDAFDASGGTSSVSDSATILSNTGQLSLDKTSYIPGEDVGVTLTDQDLTGLANVQVIVTAGGDSESLTLYSAGNGVFTASISTTESTGSDNDGILNVTPGGTIDASYSDATDVSGSARIILASATVSDVPPTPDPEFQIVVRFTDNNMTASQQAAFTDAANRWSEIIVGDLPDVFTSIGLVDDIVIDASAPYIDGAYNILGQAGPREVRSGSLIPAYGIMQFDSADVPIMEANGTFTDVIMHEMGHVLGIGTMWSYMGLATGLGTSNPLFIGQAARTAYGELIGAGPTDVPLENSGGSGTRDGHWRESVFDTELMTGWAESGPMPISTITVAALQDMGYVVDMAAADAYTVPGFSSAQSSSSEATSGTGLFSDRDTEADQHDEDDSEDILGTEFTVLPPSAIFTRSSFDTGFTGSGLQFDEYWQWLSQLQIG